MKEVIYAFAIFGAIHLLIDLVVVTWCILKAE